MWITLILTHACTGRASTQITQQCEYLHGNASTFQASTSKYSHYPVLACYASTFQANTQVTQ